MEQQAGDTTRQLRSCVLWRRILDDRSDEFCAVRQQEDEAELEGTSIGLTSALEPFCCSYKILTNSALSKSRQLCISYLSPTGTRLLSMSRSNGGWKVEADEPFFIVADEIDLEWSPLTNMFPLRRMLEQGLMRLELKAAWVRMPDLRIERATQCYEWIDSLTARYINLESGFTALIRHDGEGFPLDYEGVWQQRSYWSNAA